VLPPFANCGLRVCYNRAMTYFIAFRLTREGKVLDTNEMYCDEAEARERARALAIDSPVELWQGPRRIARYEPSRA